MLALQREQHEVDQQEIRRLSEMYVRLASMLVEIRARLHDADSAAERALAPERL